MSKRVFGTAMVIAIALLSAFSLSQGKVTPLNVHGVVAGTYFTPPAGSTASSTSTSYFSGATVCVDSNKNGLCDLGEDSRNTDADGSFVVTSHQAGPLIAEISTLATNGGHPVEQRMVLRAALEQVEEGAVNAGKANHQTPASTRVVITPASTEVLRLMEADHLDYQTAKFNFAKRLEVPLEQALSDPNALEPGPSRNALLQESVILSKRFALAAKMFDRGTAGTMKDAQTAAMNLESIPRYDHIFVIVLENKQTPSIKNSPLAPQINAYLNANNQFTSYFANGNPSEPNRLAVTAGDDFGITDDSAFNCRPAGDTANAPEDPLPAGLNANCVNDANHNIKNKPNLLTAMSAAGMTWRVYNESMNPGRDPRLNGTNDATLLAPDHIYPMGTTPFSTNATVGTPGLMLRYAGSLYATKHNESVNFQSVRSATDFFSNNRTMGGGQFDEAFKNSPNTPAGWDVDQLGTDLWSGDVGNLNYLEPDQCDDMHGTTVQGAVGTGTTLVTASDCGSSGSGIWRGDLYTDYLIKKIQASPIWTNTQKRVAIVISYDEGSATTGFNSCCGWNPSAGSSIAGKSLGTLVQNADGTVSVESVAHYNQGNKGHGTSVFGVITNQPLAPKGIVDSDAYSHIAFVRTLQDMFGLADPGDPWSYMNRSKYTESFITQYLSLLPEYANSADKHFDAVRPMNHAYVISSGYVQKSGFVTPPGAQTGPDANQVNPWALH